ncbi:hypothetical protein EB796_009224 [Bugula neritina]|uniref:Uncharacterized protein n=1 Tax=Bugula neritina TaxID=10212 RepID=A0A7J7K1A1_BUGNE|nr:hypothetical protein EB796_009224 [Bugula neritina]
MLFLKDAVMMLDMLDTLDTCVAEIETKAESITSDYAKLLQLSDNKVEAKIEKHFEFFIGEVGKITEKILEIQQSMAIQEEQGEEQEELASKKKLLEEEQRKFEEYLAEREKVQLVEEQTRQLQLAAAESTPLNRNSVKDEKNLEVHVIRTDPIDLWSAPTTPPNTDVKPRENLQYLSGNERANYAFKTSQSSDDSIRQLNQ